MNRLLGLTLGTLCAIGACRPSDQRTESVDVDAVRTNLDAELLSHLDSGNAAYRGNDLDAAVGYYERATQLAPERAEGWFGLYMAERARGNLEAASNALARAREAAPGASLLRTDPEDTIR